MDWRGEFALSELFGEKAELILHDELDLLHILLQLAHLVGLTFTLSEIQPALADILERLHNDLLQVVYPATQREIDMRSYESAWKDATLHAGRCEVD